MSSEVPPETDRALRGVMKRIEQKNIERIQKMENLNRRNRKVGLGITCMVFGIYIYSMWAVKQETVLDELDQMEGQKVKR